MALNHEVNGSPVEVKHIIINSNSANYLVKDNKLVFADSDLYLSGPTTYDIVGTPTITDGVVSSLSNSNYLKMHTLPTLGTQDFELFIKATPGALKSMRIATDNAGGNYCTGVLMNNTSGQLQVLAYGSDQTHYVKNSSVSAVANSPFWLKFYREGTTLGVKVSLDGTNYTTDTTTIPADASLVFYGNTFGIGSAISYGNAFNGSIDMKECYLKVGGTLYFYGKNYASPNIAPVPSSYTYGNTTTSAIGWVDMRTQAFSAAPAGATLGKDE